MNTIDRTVDALHELVAQVPIAVRTAAVTIAAWAALTSADRS